MHICISVPNIMLHVYVPHPIDEGVYVNAAGGQLKDSRLQWGEVPSSIGKRCTELVHKLLFKLRYTLVTRFFLYWITCCYL